MLIRVSSASQQRQCDAAGCHRTIWGRVWLSRDRFSKRGPVPENLGRLVAVTLGVPMLVIPAALDCIYTSVSGRGAG